MVTFGEKYVERVEKALVETVCLEHCRRMPMTVDQCWSKVQALGFTNKVDRGFVEDAMKRLDRDGHLKKEGDRFTVTDDGREDIVKVENVLRNVQSVFAGGVAGATGATGVAGTRRT